MARNELKLMAISISTSMKMCSHGDQTKSEDKKVIHPAVLLTWSLKFFCTTSDMTMFI